nr:flagellar hook-length control protein FliK [uncultured Cohaesibacter sp.]
MAMEIARPLSLAQVNAENGLLKALAKGQPVEAKLQTITALPKGEAQLRLSLGGQVMQLQIPQESAAKLTPGISVTLQSTQTPQGPQLTISPAASSGTNQNAAQNVTQSGMKTASGGDMPSGAKAPPGAQTTGTQAVSTQTTSSQAAGQSAQPSGASSGSAVLVSSNAISNAGSGQPSSALPTSYGPAATTSTAPSPQSATIISSSGLNGPGSPNMPTSAGAASSVAPSTTSSTSSNTAISTPLQAALVSLQRQAMSQQRPMTELFANLTAFMEQVDAGQRPAPKQDIEAAMRWVLGFQFAPKSQQPTGKAATALKDILSALGFLAKTPTDGSAGQPTANLKAALTLLRDLLPQATGQPQASSAQNTGKGDQPPLAGMKLHGQSPGTASILPSDSQNAALARIRSDVEAALARATLTQIASLRSAQRARATMGGAATQAQPQTFHLEIPLLLANGTAILPMTIEQDWEETDEAEEQDDAPDEARRKKRKSAGWRVNFAVDAEPVGPVDIAIKLNDQHLHISLAPERDETIALFKQTAPLLQTMLEAEGLTLEGLTITRQKQRQTDPMGDHVPLYQTRLDRKL